MRSKVAKAVRKRFEARLLEELSGVENISSAEGAIPLGARVWRGRGERGSWFVFLQPDQHHDAFTVEVAWSDGASYPWETFERRRRLSTLVTPSHDDWWEVAERPDLLLDPSALFESPPEAEVLSHVEPVVEDAVLSVIDVGLPWLHEQVGAPMFEPKRRGERRRVGWRRNVPVAPPRPLVPPLPRADALPEPDVVDAGTVEVLHLLRGAVERDRWKELLGEVVAVVDVVASNTTALRCEQDKGGKRRKQPFAADLEEIRATLRRDLVGLEGDDARGRLALATLRGWQHSLNLMATDGPEPLRGEWASQMTAVRLAADAIEVELSRSSSATRVRER